MRCLVFTGLLLALSVGANVFGQNAGDDAFFRGSVIDAATCEPIPFVRMVVHRPDEAWDGTTDFDGAFMFRCPKKWMFVEVLKKGYVTEYMVVDLSSGWVELQFSLVPKGYGGVSAYPCPV